MTSDLYELAGLMRGTPLVQLRRAPTAERVT